MEKACMRLKDSTRLIAEIADSVGYINQFYFAKEFKRLIGTTPTEYRNNPHELKIFNYKKAVPNLKKKFVNQLYAYETDITRNLTLNEEE
jgi:AraC-like DNA-binding protein